MRIAVLRDPASVNALYRAVIPMEALARRGHDVRWDAIQGRQLNHQLLQGCDVVFIHRLCDEEVQRAVDHLRGRGVAIWWDNDDDIGAITKENPLYREYSGLRGKRFFAGMKRLVEMTDLVTTPSATLAEVYEEMGAANVEVLENHLPAEFLTARRRERGDDAVVVGWTAGLEHRHDYEALELRPVFERLLATMPNVRFVSVGVSLGLSGRYEHIPRVGFNELAERAGGYDIGIAPITDTRLNRSRSNVKLKEYAAAAVPWLASPVGPYIGMGEKQGGRLVADDEWFTAITDLADSARSRRKLGKRARRWAETETIDSNLRSWEAALASARRRAQEPMRC